VVTAGEGVIRSQGEEIAIRQGEQLFLPASIEEPLLCRSMGGSPLKLVRCFPPQ
jgi:mannose-6-phosphate isomerase class I